MASLVLYLPARLMDELLATAKASGEAYNNIVTDALRRELDRRASEQAIACGIGARSAG